MMKSFSTTALLLVASMVTSASAGGNFNAETERALAEANWPGVIRSAIGVTRRETTIPSLINADDLDYNTTKTRILLVGGLDGSKSSVDAILAALEWFYTSDEAQPLHARFAVSAVPIANPDGWATGKGPGNLADGNPTKGYPPKGTAYNSPTDPEAAYLWRWIGMHAPDLVVVVESAERRQWTVPARADEKLKRLAARLSPLRIHKTDDSLISQLIRVAPSQTGTVPALSVDVRDADRGAFLQSLLSAAEKAKFTGPSPARKQLQQRMARTPIEVAKQLSKRYGHELNRVVYIPALALIGRLRLGELSKDASHLADVEKIVEPYFAGRKPTLPQKISGSHYSGHLVFGELAVVTGKKRYIELAKAAADLGFDEQGNPKEAMTPHYEMSDSVFMGCPILARVGRLTAEQKYYAMCVRQMRFLLRLNLRGDGLHRHSPLHETPWGRGNGFPALGLAMSLADMPKDHPGRKEMLGQFRAHMAAMAKYQDPTGMWHQVVDHVGSYREFSSTAMTTFAMIRGVRSGWLDEKKYSPLIDKAFKAILTRIAPDATLVDMCTGTGKQKSLRAYFDRTAILGPDNRGGAMALLVTTEMAAWQAAGVRRNVPEAAEKNND